MLMHACSGEGSALLCIHYLMHSHSDMIVGPFNPYRKAYRQRGYCYRLAIFVHIRPSVRPLQPSYAKMNGKGHLRESTHSRYTGHKGIVVMVSPAQWYSSERLLPVCVYVALTSAT